MEILKKLAAEFRRFTSVKENYLDMLAVLSRGPYSHVDASAAGCSEDEWLTLSDTIRKYHELTHVICRKQYPNDTIFYPAQAASSLWRFP